MATTKGEIVEQFRCQAIREAAMRVVSRKGVLEKTMSISFEEFHALIRDAIGRGGTFRECVEQVVKAQLDFFEQQQQFFRLYLAMAEPLGERRLRKHASYRTHIAQLVSMV